MLSLRVASPSRKPKTTRANREFDPSKYSTRLIALKFAYLGQRYNGLEYHPNNDTPLPTVEEKLWQVLNKARLVFPTPNPTLGSDQPNWEGCEYSKCGRTDRGVSAFGQVIGIRVRSNRPVYPAQKSAPTELKDTAVGGTSYTKDREANVPPIISTTSTEDDASSTLSCANESADEEAHGNVGSDTFSNKHTKSPKHKGNNAVNLSGLVLYSFDDKRGYPLALISQIISK